MPPGYTCYAPSSSFVYRPAPPSVPERIWRYPVSPWSVGSQGTPYYTGPAYVLTGRGYWGYWLNGVNYSPFWSAPVVLRSEPDFIPAGAVFYIGDLAGALPAGEYPVDDGAIICFPAGSVTGTATPYPSPSPTPSPTRTPTWTPTPGGAPCPVVYVPGDDLYGVWVDRDSWLSVYDGVVRIRRDGRWIDVPSYPSMIRWTGASGYLSMIGPGSLLSCPRPIVPVTGTPTPSVSPSPNAAELILTAVAGLTRTPTLLSTPQTRTPTATRTPTVTRTPAATRTPTVTRTPYAVGTSTPLAPTPDRWQWPSPLPVDTPLPVELTPFPSWGDISVDGSLVGGLIDLLVVIGPIVQPQGRYCAGLAGAPPASSSGSPFQFSWSDAVAGICSFLDVASPVLDYVRLPVTIVIAFGFIWRIFRTVRSLAGG